MLTAFLALIGYISIIFLGHYVIDEKEADTSCFFKIVDQNGDEVASLYTENREPVSINEIPKQVREAFIAVEDKGSMSITALMQNLSEGQCIAIY